MESQRSHIALLTSKGIHNGALVAENYTNGDVLAYVGSAGYYLDTLRSKKFNPKFDVAGTGFRQPGSAFKPLVYTTGFDTRKLTPGSVLLDVTTPFGQVVDPRGRGRPRARTRARPEGAPVLAEHPRHAGDRPHRAGKAVDQAAYKAGLHFIPGVTVKAAGLAGAIGTTEVHLDEMTSVYGAFGNGGYVIPPRMILDVKDSSGNEVYQPADPSQLKRKVWSAQAAWQMANILEGNSDASINIEWGPVFEDHNGPRGQQRPLALKTGTTNDVRDMSTYGLIAQQPKGSKHPSIAVGVWMGNSDHTPALARECRGLLDQRPGSRLARLHGQVHRRLAGDRLPAPQGPRAKRPSTHSAAASPVRGRARPSTSGSSTARSRAATTRSILPERSTCRRAAAGRSIPPRPRTPAHRRRG